MTESGVAEALRGLEKAHEGLTLGYRAHFPEIEVKVHVRADSAAEAERLSHSIADEVRARLGDAVFGGRADSFAEVVGKALRDEGKTLAVAESCTGGQVGEMLTRVPGASDYLLLDAVVYANSAKEAVLGVSPEVLIDAWRGELGDRRRNGGRRASGRRRRYRGVDHRRGGAWRRYRG